jgi:phosphatidate cytidylyltransferase
MMPTADLALLAIVALLSLLLIIGKVAKLRLPLGSYSACLWTFFLMLAVADLISFRVAIWLLALLSFVALREYFTLVDIRLQDRWGIVGAHLAIPFMVYFISIDWYGMFIISIPVYAFLVIPFLVALGGRETEGTVFSIGVIDFGLFLLVYCIGHIGYLALFATWKAGWLILSVAACDFLLRYFKASRMPFWSRALLRYCACLPQTLLLAWGHSGWSGIPQNHALVLGAMVPALVGIGRFTVGYVKADLGVESKRPQPGKGQMIDSLQSFLYAAPIVFHYIRYYLTS